MRLTRCERPFNTTPEFGFLLVKNSSENAFPRRSASTLGTNDANGEPAKPC